MKWRFTPLFPQAILRFSRHWVPGRCGRLLVFVGLGGSRPTSGSDSTTFQGTGVGSWGGKILPTWWEMFFFFKGPWHHDSVYLCRFFFSFSLHRRMHIKSSRFHTARQRRVAMDAIQYNFFWMVVDAISQHLGVVKMLRGLSCRNGCLLALYNKHVLVCFHGYTPWK